MRKVISVLATAALTCSILVGGSMVQAARSPHPRIAGSLSTIGGPAGPWQDLNNPYAPGADTNPAANMIYETLLQWNSENGRYAPWLATKWSWDKSNTVLTVDLRQGVQWSNGTAFTSKDVVFTFDMLKKYPAVDANGLWTYLKAVTAAGPYTVKMTLRKPSAVFFFYMATAVRIVPEALWAHVDPVTFTNPHPVGTGPYLFHSFSAETITLVRNPHYWQAPKPYLQTVTFPAEASNTTAVLGLAEGKIQWAGVFSFDLQRSYISRNPKTNHVGLYPNGFDVLYVNLHHYPLNLLVVRQAMSAALNRTLISQIGFSGYSPAVTDLLAVSPGLAATWTTPALQRRYKVVFDPAVAKSMLLKAGFKMGSNGILLTPKGQPFTLSIDVCTPCTDFAAASEQIAAQLKQIGIQVTLQNNSANQYQNKLHLGQFDIAVCWAPWGANPFFTLYPFMSQTYSAPFGQYATANFERYSNPQVERLGAEFNATEDQQKQVAVTEQLEQIFASQLPVIPLVHRNTPEEYSTAHLAGWPTRSNPYWNLRQGNLPVLVNLYWK